MRIFGTIYNLFTAKTGDIGQVAEDVIESMGIEGDEKLEALAEKLEKESNERAPIDARWIITFLFILFFIHLGRMGLGPVNFWNPFSPS
ncbi:MAG: hypothetical protein U5K51_11875 [Flavobacteriaceae bacterium]|nr:hypothetical protein [Flavobacteriaceae bacterium]